MACARRDFVRDARFLCTIFLSATRSTTACEALSVAAAAALSPAAIAFLTCLTAVRNDERRLALCLFLVIACRARLRAWALFAILFSFGIWRRRKRPSIIAAYGSSRKQHAPPLPHRPPNALHLSRSLPRLPCRRAPAAGAGERDGASPMNLLRAVSTVSAMTLLSRITGLARESLKAFAFGAGLQMDAFEAAFRLPNILRRLFAEGAFSQAFVPILAEYKLRRGDEGTRDLVGRVGTLLAVVLLVLSIVGVLAAPWLVYVLAGGFAQTPGKVDLTAM